MLYLFVGGLAAFVAGVAAYDWRAGLIVAGVVSVLVALYWEGDK